MRSTGTHQRSQTLKFPLYSQGHERQLWLVEMLREPPRQLRTGEWTFKIENHGNSSTSGPPSQRLQSAQYSNSSRVGGPKTMTLINKEDLGDEGTIAGIAPPPIHGQDKPADHFFTELYAEDHNLSEIHISKNTSLKYIWTKM